MSQNGPRKAYDVIHSARDGPLPAEYIDILKVTQRENQTCYPSKTYSCGVAINGFGTIGEVHYTFRSSHLNIEGSSIQVMVSCRCLNKNECNKCLLMRPVNVCDPGPDGSKCKTPVTRTCLYEQDISSGVYSDGITELLRMTRRPREIGLQSVDEGQNFTYQESNVDNSFEWKEVGQQIWSRKCPSEDINSLPTLDLSNFEGEVGFNVHETDPKGNCKPPPGVRYYREESQEKGEECANLYDYAASAAAFRGTQQDEFAIGKHELTYMDPKPSLFSNTELALSCSAPALGLLCVWLIFRRQLKKGKKSIRDIMALAMMQFLSYVLEALPLHVAMIQEIKAENWIGRFSFLEASLEVAKDTQGPQGSAAGSIMILTAIIGQVGIAKTRYQLVVVLTVLFDSFALVVIIWTTCMLYKRLQAARRAGEVNESESYKDWIVGTSYVDDSCGNESRANLSSNCTTSNGSGSGRDGLGVGATRRSTTTPQEVDRNTTAKGKRNSAFPEEVGRNRIESEQDEDQQREQQGKLKQKKQGLIYLHVYNHPSLMSGTVHIQQWRIS